MIPWLTISREDRTDIDPTIFVCSYLVHASRQATYDLALANHTDPGICHSAIKALKVVHRDWLEAQKLVARELPGAKTAVPEGQHT